MENLHSLPRLPSPLPLAIALTEGDTPLSFLAPSVPPATPIVSTTLTVAGPSTDIVFALANRQSPDEEEELRAQIQQLKDLNKRKVSTRWSKSWYDYAWLKFLLQPLLIFSPRLLALLALKDNHWGQQKIHKLPHLLREILPVMRSRTIREGLAVGLHFVHLLVRGQESVRPIPVIAVGLSQGIQEESIQLFLTEEFQWRGRWDRLFQFTYLFIPFLQSEVGEEVVQV